MAPTLTPAQSALLERVKLQGTTLVSIKNPSARVLAAHRLVHLLPAVTPGEVVVLLATPGRNCAAMTALVHIILRIDAASGSPSWTAEEHDLLAAFVEN